MENNIHPTAAVVAAVGGYVTHSLRAVDGLLQQGSDAGFDSLRVGAGVKRAHRDRGRGQITIFGDGKGWTCLGNGQRNKQRAYCGKYLPAYEEVENGLNSSLCNPGAQSRTPRTAFNVR